VELLSGGGLTLLVFVLLYTGLPAALEKQLDLEIFIPLSGLHLYDVTCASVTF